MRNFILLLLFCSFSVNAQKCKFEYNEFDDFTKIKKVKTNAQPVAATLNSSIRFSLRKANNLYLEMERNLSGIKAIVIGKDDKLSLMLKDDSIIELYAVKVSSGNISSNRTKIENSYKITIDQLEQIRKVGLKKIRLYSTEFYYDYEVTKDKWVDKFNNDIDCFYNEITYD